MQVSQSSLRKDARYQFPNFQISKLLTGSVCGFVYGPLAFARVPLSGLWAVVTGESGIPAGVAQIFGVEAVLYDAGRRWTSGDSGRHEEGHCLRYTRWNAERDVGCRRGRLDTEWGCHCPDEGGGHHNPRQLWNRTIVQLADDA
jgi:hypothetical protein